MIATNVITVLLHCDVINCTNSSPVAPTFADEIHLNDFKGITTPQSVMFENTHHCGVLW